MKPENLNDIVKKVGGTVTEVFGSLPTDSLAPQVAFADVFPDVITGLVENNKNITLSPQELQELIG